MTLKAGQRYGGTGAIQHPDAEPLGPSASWVLQVYGGQWVLLLSSYSPGDLDLPRGFANQDLVVADADGALEWARSVVPDTVENTITQS